MKTAGKILAGFLIVVIVICLAHLIPEWKEEQESTEVQQRISEIIEDTKEDDPYFSRDSWEILKRENPEFEAYLLFESGLIKQPVVRTMDNETYLTKAFDGSYSSQGTAFMDSTSSLDSMNIPIYGHNVYYDSSAMFSPLHQLTDQKRYEENSIIRLYTEKEVRIYQITNVFYISEQDAEVYDFTAPYFRNQAVFNTLMEYADAKNEIRNIYDPIRYGDNVLTLQTCRKWSNDHLIVLARENSSYRYE